MSWRNRTGRIARPASILKMSLVMIFVPVAAVPDIIEFTAAFFGLPAVLAMLLNGYPQVFFGLVNIAITSFIRARGQ